MSTKQGNLLWRRMQITVPAAGNLIVDTGLKQANQAFPPGDPVLFGTNSFPSTPSRVQVIALPPYANWANVQIFEPQAPLVGDTVEVTFSSTDQNPQTLNVLFFDPHSSIGPGYAEPYRPQCFKAGTLVATPRGRVAIEKLLLGDEIVALDDAGGRRVVRVRELHTSKSDHLRVLRLSNDEILCTTDKHPFASGRATWIEAEHLRGGDALISDVDGLRVASSMREPGEYTVYNLSVEAPNTFLVGESGVLVHNK